MNKFDWISDFVKNLKAVHSINDFIPNLFDRYFLIPWAVGIIDRFPFTDYPNNKGTIENLNKQQSIERDFGIFLMDNNERQYRKVTLKEIAQRFQVQYCADTANLVKATPGISPLLGATVQTLKELILHLQNDQILNLYVEDDFRFQAVHETWKYNKENVKIAAADYLSYQQDTAWDSTSYLFPVSKDWCLCTLENYHHFIFCCDNSSYKYFEALTSIEAFEVDYNFQINWVFA